MDAHPALPSREVGLFADPGLQLRKLRLRDKSDKPEVTLLGLRAA